MSTPHDPSGPEEELTPWTAGPGKIVQLPSDRANGFNDVGDFHDKFGLHRAAGDGVGPREVPPELLAFRLKFLFEELEEFCHAIGAVPMLTIDMDNRRSLDFSFNGKVDNIDHAQAFDALIDLVYVAYGTAHLFGYPWQEGWDLVQDANMAKMRAQKDGSDSKRGSSFDVVKPEGWTPPDIEGLLETYGWTNEENE